MEDELLITYENECVPITPQPDLQSLVAVINDSVPHLPPQWSVVCEIDDDLYRELVVRGFKNMQVVPTPSPVVHRRASTASSSGSTDLPHVKGLCPAKRPVRYATPQPQASTVENGRNSAPPTTSHDRQRVLEPLPPAKKPPANRTRPLKATAGNFCPPRSPSPPASFSPVDLSRDPTLNYNNHYPVAGLDEALENARAAAERMEAVYSSLKTDSATLAEVNELSQLLLEEEKLLADKRPTEVHLPRPPTSVYEACQRIGVESISLAATSPPLLKSPRYRVSTTPPPDAVVELTGQAHLCGAWSKAKRDAQAAAEESRPVGPHLAKLLALQGEELDHIDKGKAKYDSLIDEFVREAEHMFDYNKKLVEDGDWLPLDREAELKRELANLIGLEKEICGETM